MKLTFETINILFLLMPGFFCVKLFDIIAKRDVKDVFIKTTEALIFSLLIFFCIEFVYTWEPLVNITNVNGKITYHTSSNKMVIIFTIGLSLLLPIILAAILHKDWHMKFFRFMKITDKTSRETAWDDVFTEQKRFVVCHLKDERRLYGWPMYYSNNKDEGFIYLYNPAWIDDSDQYIECSTHGMLLSNDNIEFTEFILEKGENHVG